MRGRSVVMLSAAQTGDGRNNNITTTISIGIYRSHIE
jgi:hypothetical protein